MGLRTWIYEHTGIKLKKFDDSLCCHDDAQKDVDRGNVIFGFIHPSVWIHWFVKFGNFSYMHRGGIIYTNCEIGRYCSIAPEVIIGASKHPLTNLSTLYDPNSTPLKTTIGNDVWIGAKVVIQSGVSVGDGAVIGSGAVVTKDVPPYAIVAGVPAKILRYRFDEATILELLEIKWWDLDPEQLSGAGFESVRDGIEKVKKIKQDSVPQR